jgi:chromate transport protein ChrA
MIIWKLTEFLAVRDGDRLVAVIVLDAVHLMEHVGHGPLIKAVRVDVQQAVVAVLQANKINICKKFRKSPPFRKKLTNCLMYCLGVMTKDWLPACKINLGAVLRFEQSTMPPE